MRQPHKGGCYGPPSQCNLLQIQGAQLPKSRPCHLQLLRLPRVFLLPQFRGVICMGLPMQHTCSTHATHMQHKHFPCKFPSKVAAGAKMDIFHSKTGVGGCKRQILHVDCKFTGEKLMLHFVSHVCCMCVACALHSRWVG